MATDSSTSLLTAPHPRALAVPRIGAGRLVAAGVLSLAAASLLLPSAPTYDPWSWIIWGREITGLDLSTVNGPSWKPLPVLFTTVFALFGDASAPDLWLLVARAGALAGVVAAFVLVRRLGGGVPGAAVAAVALALAPWTVRNAALGNSEGLLVACVLGAAERHLAGRRMQAFALGLGAGLLRPEAWPFLGLYSLWLVWRDRSRLGAVALGLLAVPLLWFPPELWGSGDLLRASDRAQEPNANSPAFAESPAREVLRLAGEMMTPPMWVGLGALIVAAASRRRRPGAAAGVLVLGVTWLAVVALMTEHGFSGNQRYLIVPVALAFVAAGAGLGRLAGLVGERVGLARAVPAVVCAGAVAALVTTALTSEHRVSRLPNVLRAVDYQARLSDDLGRAVSQAGGSGALRRSCGGLYTSAFLVPTVAWHLHRHAEDVGLNPAGSGTVFRARLTAASPAGPSLEGMGGEAGLNTLAATDRWRIARSCPSGQG
jgi:hypothetical protein